MFRDQPPGFRWLVGGFALVAGCAFGIRFFAGDRPSLVFGVICLALAAYWLVFDRAPADSEARASAVSEDRAPIESEDREPDG